MNAVVLNGANIGENCIIGANALVTEGTQIPSGSMALGSPAKVVKQLDSATIEMLKGGAQHYVENRARYKDHLEQVD